MTDPLAPIQMQMGSRREEAYLEANRITVLTSSLVRVLWKERTCVYGLIDWCMRAVLTPTYKTAQPTNQQLQSSEQLLMQAEQLKRIHVLQDMAAINAEVDADTRALEARYVGGWVREGWGGLGVAKLTIG